ncbi:MAG: hypothetical protein K9N62_07705 [Verrucomicrobia bacterium]|nr:hypothetical protein [Verrucomicrobiota bacterium]
MKTTRLAIAAAMLRSCAQQFCLSVVAAGMVGVVAAAELPGGESEHPVPLSRLADFDLETLLNMEVTLVSNVPWLARICWRTGTGSFLRI